MKIRVCVIFGGKSVEHEVSIISALQAVQNLDMEKYEVLPVYFAKDGCFYTGDSLLDIENYKDPVRLLKKASKAFFKYDGKETVLETEKRKRKAIDVVLPVVHGTNVEDGALQGFLRSLRVPFAGCDVLASAIGMEKTVMKTILVKSGVPVLPCVAFSTAMWNKDSMSVITGIEKDIGYPVIVKPANLGSSIGIKTAADRKQLIDAIDYARQFTLRVMAERQILNLKEINCAVLGDHEKQFASACERPISRDEILSFADKYLGNSKQKGMTGLDRELPARISAELEGKITGYAVKTFTALGCSGVARIDFLVDLDDDKVYVNEINTIPGSLSFYLFEPKKMSYPELLEELIALALKRERENAGIEYDYNTNILSAKGLRGKKR